MYRGVIIRKTPEQIEKMAAAGDDPGPLPADARARRSAPGRHHRRARRGRREFIRSQGADARRSRATAASRARSAPRRTRWSSTASPAPTSSQRGDILSIDVGVTLRRLGRRRGASRSPSATVSPRRRAAARRRPRQSLFDGVEQCRAGQPPRRRLARGPGAGRGATASRYPLARRPRDRPRDARGPADPQLRRAGQGPAARGGHGAARSSRWSTPAAPTSAWATTAGPSTPQDGSLAAHFEFTVAVTADGPRILTPWH